MKNHLPLTFLVFFISAFSFVFNAKAQTLPQFETRADNNTYNTAMPVTSNPLKLRGNIFPIGDIDYYSFVASAGDRVYAALMTSFSAGSSTDSQLSLISSDGTTIIEFDDDNGSFAGLSSSIAGAIIPITGTYYLKVNDYTAGTSSERGYDLYLKVEGTTPTSEVEPNNTKDSANLLASSGFMSGTRNFALVTEQDWYAITLNAGESVFLSLDLDPERDGIVWNGRLGMALFGDVGTVIVVDDAGTGDVTPNPNIPSEALFVTVKESGTYYVYVDASSAAVGGPTCTYNLSVSRFAAITGYISYPSVDIPKTIGPGIGSVASIISIADSKIIKNISVKVNLTHALMADVDAILTTPDGNSIHLFSDIGSATTGGQTQMDLFFNDYNAITPAFPIMKGLGYTPELNSKLDQLNGMNTAGNWTLTLYDDVANTSGGTLNNWSLDVLEDTMINWLSSRPVIFNSDFEATDGGFTHSGTADEFEWGTPATLATTTSSPVAAFLTAHSGVKCWKTDLDNTYDLSSDQILASPAVALPSPTEVLYISWAMKYQMESANFDKLTVYIEEVGGSGLTKEVFTWLGATETASPGNPTVNVPLSAGWGMYHAEITEFAGKTVQLKVRLISDNTVNMGGVAIDDVRFSGCGNTSSSITTTACDSFLCGGMEYTASGHYDITIPNAAGCDSVISLDLTINNSSLVNNPQTICQGSSYFINGHNYTIPGTYNDTLQTHLGCDSVILTVITVNPVYTLSNPQTICQGDSYFINGHNYAIQGTYNDTLQTHLGCDSVIVTVLTVNPVTTINNPQTFCLGNAYFINGHSYNMTGTYNDTLQTHLGCDSIVITVVTVNPVYSINNIQTICQGGSYTINGHTYTVPGSYNDTLQSQLGCDSIFYTTLSVESIDLGVTSNGSTLTSNQTGATYKWIDCDNGNVVISGQTNISFTATQTGNYAVIVTLGPCSDTSACQHVTVSGVEDNLNNVSQIAVYPNPNNGNFFVEVDSESSAIIYNSIGAVILSQIIPAGKTAIDLGSYSAGVYMLTVYKDGNWKSIRIIKQ